MSSGIQFGELEHAEPDLGVRPDRDAHYAVLPVNGIGMPDAKNGPENDLLIFVDLDVMRDMEAHAESDTRVELGGVMLGYQRVDEDGRPFVVITDCLRAEHYHATKGSFTFTHDTWSQITQERKKHHPDLEMIGWYHTHPGWTVFLSGMDLFICNNFFNKPLDVALVIDPVNDDRGWFQWTEGDNPVTRPTAGFYLMTNKYRQHELKYFSRLYSNGSDMNDPRYAQSSSSFGTTSPVVNIMDNRRPLTDVAIIAMLTVQFVLLGLLAWKLLAPPATPEVASEEPASVPMLVEQAREEAYRDILRMGVESNGQNPDLVDGYTKVKTENARLLANLDGQLALSEKMAGERDGYRTKLSSQTEKAKTLTADIEKTRKENQLLMERVKELGGSTEVEEPSLVMQIVWWSLIGLAIASVASIGFLFGHKNGKDSAYGEMDHYDRGAPRSVPDREAVSGSSETTERENITLSLTDNENDQVSQNN